MSLQTILLLTAIGIFAGMMSGFIGIGGGVVIVPALVYLMGMPQHTAQGTSLLLMLPPIGILAVINYYKAGHINWLFGIVIAVGFIAGAYFGSKISLKLNANLVKFIFGVFMLYVSVRMIYSGYSAGFKDNDNKPSSENRSDH